MQLRYSFRLYPTSGQRSALARAFGCARTVYNDALRARETARAQGVSFPKIGELIRAGQVAAWGRTDVWAPIVVGLILLAVFVRVELRNKMPSFDPRLLAQRAFGGGNMALGLLLFAISAVTFYNAFYLQGTRGYSPIEAGLASLPTALGAIFGAPVGARLVHRWSLRRVAVPALIVAALTMGAYGLFGLDTPLVWIEVVLLVQGLSIAMVLGPVAAELISTLPLERAGAGRLSPTPCARPAVCSVSPSAARSCRSCTDARSSRRWTVSPDR